MKNPIHREQDNKKNEITLDEEPPSHIELTDYRAAFLTGLKKDLTEEKEPEFSHCNSIMGAYRTGRGTV